MGIAIIVGAVSDLHLPVLHLGTAGMGVLSAVIYFATLLGADSSEFTKSRRKKKLEDQISNQSNRSNNNQETKPLIDMNETKKYGIDIHQRGNITVEPDSE